MGERGPKPSFAMIVGGNVSHRRGNPNERVSFSPTDPVKPKEMSAEAGEVWDELLPELQTAGRGFVVGVDAIILAMLCTEVARWRRLHADLEANGWTYTTGTGYVRNRPEADFYRDAMANVMKLGAEFGIAPGLRRRMEFIGKVPEAEIPMLPGWGESQKVIEVTAGESKPNELPPPRRKSF